MKQSETISLRSYLCLDAMPVAFEATDRFLKDGEEGGGNSGTEPIIDDGTSHPWH